MPEKKEEKSSIQRTSLREIGREGFAILESYSCNTNDLRFMKEAQQQIEEEIRPRSTHEDDERVTEMYKDRDLYLAARNGDLDHFKRILLQISTTDSPEILSRLSPSGNTFLHVAAKYNNEELVGYLAERQWSLLLAKNFDGEVALHIAAKGGHMSTVEALVDLNHRHQKQMKSDTLMAKNEIGNTALHEALLSSRDDSIATYLISKNPQVSYELNKKRRICHLFGGESWS